MMTDLFLFSLEKNTEQFHFRCNIRLEHPILVELLTFSGLADHELRRLRGVRGPGLVDGPHSELVLLSLDEVPLGEEPLGPVRLPDLLPALPRLPAPHLDGVVGDLGAAVLPRRVPLQVDAVDVPVDVAYILWGIGEAYSIRSFRTLSVHTG